MRKNKGENMRYYETIYILNTNYDSSTVDKCKKEIEKELKEFLDANIINHYIWTKKRLAYQIKKQKYGLFILLHFESLETKNMPDFNKWMKLNNHIMRHMTVSLESKPDIHDGDMKAEKPEVDEEVLSNGKNDAEASNKGENNYTDEKSDADSQVNVEQNQKEDLNETEKEQENDIPES